MFAIAIFLGLISVSEDREQTRRSGHIVSLWYGKQIILWLKCLHRMPVIPPVINAFFVQIWMDPGVPGEMIAHQSSVLGTRLVSGSSCLRVGLHAFAARAHYIGGHVALSSSIDYNASILITTKYTQLNGRGNGILCTAKRHCWA